MAGISKYVPKYMQRQFRDSVTYLILLAVILTAAVGLYKGGVHLAELKPEHITIRELPSALALSLMRMTASYLASLLFSFVLGLVAARSAVGERLIIPFLDIMQSVPVIGFFPAAITFFIGIGHESRIGVEMAASFLIFTSQAWNMAFAVYEAAKTIPQDNLDAITSFGVRGSQRFWKLYAPACVPRLVYNSILSWSNGWYFLVACEIIAVGPVHYNLPGIGSFLARAAEQDRIPLVGWGLLALTLLILSLDFLIWRPASNWAERFRQDFSAGAEVHRRRKQVFLASFLPPQVEQSIRPLGQAFRKMAKILSYPFLFILKDILLPILWDLPSAIAVGISKELYSEFALPAWNRWKRIVARARWVQLVVLWGVGVAIGLFTSMTLVRWLRPPWPSLAREIPLAILLSTARISFTMAISFLWILPLVYFTWNRPKIRVVLNTIAQVGGGLPAVALFPLLIVLLVKRFGGGMEAASILLLLTGMQWYILFNALGGAAVIPPDLAEAIRGLGLSRYQVWKKLVLPAIRPALITGAITAWGGGWNALVLSEYVVYKDQTLTVRGIGALLNRAVYQLGDNRAITLCIAAMVGWIIIVNTVVWRPLYQSASERYKFDA